MYNTFVVFFVKPRRAQNQCLKFLAMHISHNEGKMTRLDLMKTIEEMDIYLK